MSTVTTAPTTTTSSGSHPMKLTVSRETFLARLGIAVRGVSTRSAIQTLSGVMLKVEDGQLELQATDMEMGIRVGVDTDSAEDGSVVLPGPLPLAVVRPLPQDGLSPESRTPQQDVEVVSGSPRFHPRPLPSEDSPNPPEPKEEGALSVPAG